MVSDLMIRDVQRIVDWCNLHFKEAREKVDFGLKYCGVTHHHEV